jgi:hypothetical protein
MVGQIFGWQAGDYGHKSNCVRTGFDIANIVNCSCNNIARFILKANNTIEYAKDDAKKSSIST